jgi:hypothetical protein
MGAGDGIEQGSRSQPECRVQVLLRNHVPGLFHKYVIPCYRGKCIPGLGLPV